MRRGMIDPEYETWVQGWRADDGAQTARIYERRAAIGRAHGECVDAQYTSLDRRIERQYGIDAQVHEDRVALIVADLECVLM